MKIYVGSTNPVKINAVTIAASETWPDLTVEGLSVDSGVSEQPLTDQETKQGAINRAQNVLKKSSSSNLHSNKNNKQILAVGLEGGVFEAEDNELWCTVWAAVCSRGSDVFTCNGARFKVPQIISKRIRNGEEMGPIMADLFDGRNVKEQEGMIGIVTQGFIDRTEEYVGVTKMAIGLWYGQNWQDQIP